MILTTGPIRLPYMIAQIFFRRIACKDPAHQRQPAAADPQSESPASALPPARPASHRWLHKWSQGLSLLHQRSASRMEHDARVRIDRLARFLASRAGPLHRPAQRRRIHLRHEAALPRLHHFGRARLVKLFGSSNTDTSPPCASIMAKKILQCRSIRQRRFGARIAFLRRTACPPR